MTRYLSCVILIAFALCLGCGPDNRVIPPKDAVPPMPKGPPKAGDGPGAANKGDAPGPVSP